MPKKAKLYYQTCREFARMSQEEAISYLNIADTATLSRIENGHGNPPDQKLVAKMVELYKVPYLAVWHIRYANPDLVRYLPNVENLESEGDVYMQCDMIKNAVVKCAPGFKHALREGVAFKDGDGIKLIRADFQSVADKSQSIVTYIDCALKNGPPPPA